MGQLRNLEDGGGRGDERERRLYATRRIGGESSLNKLALEIESGRSRGFKVSFVLLCGPFSAFAFANESENSHLSSSSSSNGGEISQL